MCYVRYKIKLRAEQLICTKQVHKGDGAQMVSMHHGIEAKNSEVAMDFSDWAVQQEV